MSSLYLMGMSRCIWGYAHWRLHGGTLGLDTLARNARWMQERGMEMYYSLISGWVADAMAENGRWVETQRACQDAADRAALGEISGAAMASRAAARHAIADNRLEDARQHLSQAGAFAESRGALHEVAANHLMSARLYHAQHRPEDAGTAIDRAKAHFAELGLDHRVAMATALADELRIPPGHG